MNRYFAAFIFLIVSTCSATASSILKYDNVVYRPFHVAEDGSARTDWAALRERGDPLQVTTKLFHLLRLAKHSRIAKRDAAAGLRMFLNHWPSVNRDHGIYRWNYTKPYESIGAGWWSGMDAFLAAAVLVAADEVFKRQIYRTLARQVLHSAIKSPAQGGSLWRVSGDWCWISEYSWQGMKFSDEFYVLNGHLFGLQALKMTADALGDRDGWEAYQCAVRGTAHQMEKYKRPDWSLYMLHQPRINPAHYMIFELSQFDALAALTDEAVFKEGAVFRRSVLAKQYPLYIDANNDLMLVKYGAPHPYEIDIYRSRVECSYEDGKWEGAENGRGDAPQVDRAVLRFHLPRRPKSCTLYSLMGGTEAVPLYTAVPIDVTPESSESVVMPSELQVYYDAVSIAGRSVIIKPTLRSDVGPEHYTSLQANFKLRGNFDVSNTDLFGVEISTVRPSKISVSLVDDKGIGISRYYEPLDAGEQIILLSKVGFDNYERLGPVKTISISLYTDEASMPRQSDYVISVGEVVLFKSSAALESYLKRGRTIPERKPVPDRSAVK